jgi:hypothetical protein
MTDRDISKYDQDVQDYIKELRDEAKNNRLRAAELDAKIRERDELVAQASSKIDELTTKVSSADKIRTDYETLRDEHAQVLAKDGSTQLELARLKVAVEVGIPEFADRLKGDDADALKADAVALKKSLGHGGTPGRRPGVAFDRTDAGSGSSPELDPIRSAIAQHLITQEGGE